MQKRHTIIAAALAASLCAPIAAAQAVLQLGAGTDAGAGSVRFYDSSGGIPHNFQPFGSGYTGGVTVALADTNRDGVPDVIVAGTAAGDGVVDWYNGQTGEFLGTATPFPGFTGGVFVAAGDVNGDGAADIVTGAGAGGGPHVRVFSGTSGAELRNFFPFPQGFTGGVRVAAGDVNGDGRADLVTAAGAGGGPHVKVFDGRSGAVLHDFQPYASGFSGGVYVAAGDVNADGLADVVTGSGAGGGPHVKVFDGRSGAEIGSFFAFDVGFTGGVRVAAGDVDGDGLSDVIAGAGPGGPPHVRSFLSPSNTVSHDFFAFDAGFTGGIFVTGVAAVANLFADGFEE